eukprot:scaffold7066_cov253-Pinguiococcus_pyrenoidosus.AAC.22
MEGGVVLLLARGHCHVRVGPDVRDALAHGDHLGPGVLARRRLRPLHVAFVLRAGRLVGRVRGPDRGQKACRDDQKLHGVRWPSGGASAAAIALLYSLAHTT